MSVISLLQQLKAKDLIEGIIRNKDQQIKSGNTTPLISDLEIQNVFKNEDKERGSSVIDLINGLVNLLLLEN